MKGWSTRVYSKSRRSSAVDLLWELQYTMPCVMGLEPPNFFNVAAEVARGVDRISVQPVWDRTSLLSPRDPPQIEGAVREFLSLEKGSEPYGQAIGKVARVCFTVKEEWLDRLKSVLLEKSGLNFTTFEALGAFLWRAK